MEQIVFISLGLLLTLFLGCFCEFFLQKSVIAKARYIDVQSTQTGGGGRQLGVLERLLFFASLWLGEYTIAGSWLVFKAAGKWAAWQHIARLPDEGGRQAAEDRIIASSQLLGRFNNGTLYNGFCAGIGVLLAKGAPYFAHQLNYASNEWLLRCLAFGLPAIVSIWVVVQLFKQQKPKRKNR